jgi:DNA polymerase III gamma/tau subunit
LVTAPEGEDLLDVSGEDLPKLVTQAQRFSAGDLLRAIELISDALAEMRNTPDHRLLLEVALVRAAAPETDPGSTGLLGRIERLERRIGIEALESQEVAVPSGLQRSAATAKTKPAPRSVATTGDRKGQTPVSAPAADEHEGSSSPPKPAGERDAAALQESGGVGLSHVRGAWDATVVEVNRRSKRVGAFLNPSRPVEFQDDQLVVEVQSKFHATEMAAEKNRELFAEALHAALGIRPKVAFTARGEAPAPSPTSSGSGSDRGAAAGEFVDEPLSDIHEDPIELVKKGFAAQVVEEKNS